MLEMLGFLAPLFYILMWFISAICWRDWKFGVNYMSDLGVCPSFKARIAFNAGCVIAGFAFAFYSFYNLTGADSIVTVLELLTGGLMGFFFGLIGIVDENKRPYHRYITYTVLLNGFLYLISISINSFIRGDYPIIVFVILGIVITYIPLRSKKWQMSECLGALVIMLSASLYIGWNLFLRGA